MDRKVPIKISIDINVCICYEFLFLYSGAIYINIQNIKVDIESITSIKFIIPLFNPDANMPKISNVITSMVRIVVFILV